MNSTTRHFSTKYRYFSKSRNNVVIFSRFLNFLVDHIYHDRKYFYICVYVKRFFIVSSPISMKAKQFYPFEAFLSGDIHSHGITIARSYPKSSIVMQLAHGRKEGRRGVLIIRFTRLFFRVSPGCLFGPGPRTRGITLPAKMKGRKLDSSRHDQRSPAEAHTYVDDSARTPGTVGRTLRKNEYAAP